MNQLKKNPNYRENLNMQLANKLNYLHEMTGHTDREVADAVGVFITTYKRYRRGKQFPAFKNLMALSSFFNVPLDFLIGSGIYGVWEQVLDIRNSVLDNPWSDIICHQVLMNQTELDLIHYLYSREAFALNQTSTIEEIKAYIYEMVNKKK